MNSTKSQRAAFDLVNALEEWRSSGAHISTVMAAIQDYVEAKIEDALPNEVSP